MYTGPVSGLGMVAVHSNVNLELSGLSAGVSPGEGNSAPPRGFAGQRK